MKEIRKVLDYEIKSGLIDWNKLSQKIFAALNMVDNKFNCMRDDSKKINEMKFSDALSFNVGKGNDKKSYKIIKPRFTKGKLYCSGLLVGGFDLRGRPFYSNSSEKF